MSDSEKANQLSACAALLDYYGDRSVSFASLFLASIFGLVASGAIIQGLTNSISTLKYPIVDWAVFAISLFVFITFAYMGNYNYFRWTQWSSIAETFMTIYLIPAAKLKERYFLLPIKKSNIKARDFLEESAKCKGDKLESEEKKDEIRYKVNMATYYEYERRLNADTFFKRNITTATKFKVGYWVLVSSLGLLSYYPLLQKLFL